MEFLLNLEAQIGEIKICEDKLSEGAILLRWKVGSGDLGRSSFY